MENVQWNGFNLENIGEGTTRNSSSDDDNDDDDRSDSSSNTSSKPLTRHRLGYEELLGDSFVPPLNAGMSCLAALPSQVHHLVPEPYRWLSADGSVEDIYASCMDADSNVFEYELFRSVCHERIEQKRGQFSSARYCYRK